jgi:ubiquinone/menaquinone biosynthesis C-methylase UbiE
VIDVGNHLSDRATKDRWEASFQEQIARHAYNTAPVEAVVRTVAYHLRDHGQDQTGSPLHFLEVGCGAGPNLIWLAERGIDVSGVDISPTALELARRNLEQAGRGNRVQQLLEASVSRLPFGDGMFDGVIEACVFQHLSRGDRLNAFAEVGRVLKKGGIFVGYLLDAGHSIYRAKRRDEVSDDPGTLVLSDNTSKMYLTNIGLSHFFRADEFSDLLKGFSIVDPCLTTYYLPRSEAKRRGYDEYLQSMWTVYAVK